VHRTIAGHIGLNSRNLLRFASALKSFSPGALLRTAGMQQHSLQRELLPTALIAVAPAFCTLDLRPSTSGTQLPCVSEFVTLPSPCAVV